ncbi:MAG: TIGR02757 family protein [Crocinitomicaceae bacterium]|nr:TIGR02757 family protein [Crocinitomicaceae bacterium]MDG1659639.1 TIGR02757 family protein [Crocinitomicaceae bacterium]
MTKPELKEYLDFKAEQYNQKSFIATDPIQIPHKFAKKEDIEIIGFLVATIAWGQRATIIKNGEKLIRIMNNDPHDFILNYESQPLEFVHRTFNATDLDFFFRSLRVIYEKGDLESVFCNHSDIPGIKGRIISFRESFLGVEHEKRSEKHLSNPLKNSAAKRINMFLRWMVRDDQQGVDFGIWKSIPKSELYLPLDVHTSRHARNLGLLNRKQDDWKALEELMNNLSEFDPVDPCKYDFALFGIGAFE